MEAICHIGSRVAFDRFYRQITCILSKYYDEENKFLQGELLAYFPNQTFETKYKETNKFAKYLYSELIYLALVSSEKRARNQNHVRHLKNALLVLLTNVFNLNCSQLSKLKWGDLPRQEQGYIRIDCSNKRTGNKSITKECTPEIQAHIRVLKQYLKPANDDTSVFEMSEKTILKSLERGFSVTRRLAGLSDLRPDLIHNWEAFERPFSLEIFKDSFDFHNVNAKTKGYVRGLLENSSNLLSKIYDGYMDKFYDTEAQIAIESAENIENHQNNSDSSEPVDFRDLTPSPKADRSDKREESKEEVYKNPKYSSLYDQLNHSLTINQTPKFDYLIRQD